MSHRPRSRGPVTTLAVLAASACVAVLTACGRGGDAAAGRRARAGANAFLERYMDGNGRVVRHDQGGDTVSEGQAYAMLIALAIGDRARFDQAWRWAGEHLQRDDGLLSWHWKDGEVVDPSPAADADVDAARALVLAGRRFKAPELTEAGVDLAEAVLAHQTIRVGQDELVLAAGPWAVEPRIVNPSYLAVCAFVDPEKATGDRRWDQLRTSAHRILEELTADGGLPPDWSRLGTDGRVRPIGSPDQPDRSPRYGLDASRVPFRMAERCDGGGKDVAARLWPRLRRLDGGGAAIAYGLDGERQDEADHPTGLVGAAAAAWAAGDSQAAERLLTRAADLDQRVPTYYGSAWLAMGRTWLVGEPEGGDG
ncbi:MAG: glycosyl hydrolase family 8 [Actinomycetota bacterium]